MSLAFTAKLRELKDALEQQAKIIEAMQKQIDELVSALAARNARNERR
jgi:uncharacterized coiled-coil protein SlyX